MNELILGTLAGVEKAVIKEIKLKDPAATAHRLSDGRVLVENLSEERALTLSTVLFVARVLGVAELEAISVKRLRYAIRELLSRTLKPENIDKLAVRAHIPMHTFSENFLEKIVAREIKRVWKIDCSPRATRKLRAELYGKTLYLAIEVKGALHQRSYYVYKHPAPLSPIVACASLILAEVESKSSIYDPFVGSGTTLIEAAKILENVYCIGSDISRKYVLCALHNSREAGVEIDLFTADFKFTPIKNCDYIIADPPRGIRMKSSNIKEILEKLIKISEKIVSQKLILITPYINIVTRIKTELVLEDIYVVKSSGTKLRILLYKSSC